MDDDTVDAIEELDDIGQGERLTIRLNGLIRNYPKGPGLFKEFIQNADDAKARTVRIILDQRTHPAMQLSAPEEVAWTGPSLLIYNDAVFTEPDFKAIQDIGESSKLETGLKTGRFGLGFNVAYNVTDYPSLLSADRLIFFDPHRHHPMARKKRPGGGWRLTRGLWTNYNDLLHLYVIGGVRPFETLFNGTIFRLPLRTETSCQNSEICREPFTSKNFNVIVEEVAKAASDLLIFLKYVESITVEQCSGDTDQPTCLLRIETLNPESVRQARDLVNQVASHDCVQVLERLKSHPESAPQISTTAQDSV